jgi:hypothetical protein
MYSEGNFVREQVAGYWSISCDMRETSGW